ncbi:MAG: S-methyl-5-thioribose-1-phosphate isomerase [Chloroflexi bacterium]|nr:S-methyl-5-thioribose-1-phosphate isomerase [Anaerolineaceae bacterium]NMB90449.1 S-methyl-5-thioribose-1-phosphate isomerase [Chloroflexota bacterium]
MRTVEWDDQHQQLRLIDQRNLPGDFAILSYGDHHSVAEAIRTMVVRGAPAIGATAAFGLALAAYELDVRDVEKFRNHLHAAAQTLLASRPTAVNLGWALARMRPLVDAPAQTVDEIRARLIEEARRIAEEDVATNQRMAGWGASLIDDGDTLIHHCNTGSLAAVDWGTALGAVRMAHEQGKHVHVLVDETRPRLQGMRLTAWELDQYHIPYEIISDGAAGSFLRSGRVQKVFFGADRVAANGDVVNKIGTYMLALAAHANRVPVVCVFPTSTIDLSLANGDLVPIEEREADEVLDIQVKGRPAAPAGARACNPAFDVTPWSLLSALVTEKGVLYPPFEKGLAQTLKK